MSAADWADGPLEASASAARDGRSQLCPTAGRESTYGRTTLLIHHVGPAAVVYGPRYTGGIRELYQQLKQFQVRPAAARHSVCLADRPVRAGQTVKVNVSKEPSRRSRIANPAACVFCVLTMVVVVPTGHEGRVRPELGAPPAPSPV